MLPVLGYATTDEQNQIDLCPLEQDLLNISDETIFAVRVCRHEAKEGLRPTILREISLKLIRGQIRHEQTD